MSRLIFNDKILGQYDFALQQIKINNVDNGKTVKDIERIIGTQDLSSLSDAEFEIFKTYKHEVTHLLDGTSTLWGMEYTCRMYSWFNNPSEARLKVLSLSYAEVQMHLKLLESSNASIGFFKLNYSLQYDDKCGVFVHVHYLNEYNETIQSTPITMLSLLEGHAYSQEQLLACELYDKNSDLVSSAILLNDIKKDINRLESSEYSCFIALISQFFPELKLRQKFLIMILVSRFSLNAPAFFIGMIPESLLIHVFSKAPQELISTLKMEMSRGMHRGTYCFVILIYLAIYSETTREITNSTGFSEMEAILLTIYQRENQSLIDVKLSLQLQWRHEFEILLGLLHKKEAYLAKKISEQFIDKEWYFYDLNSIELPDFLLSKGKRAKPYKRLAFEMEEHVNDKLKKVFALEAALKEIGVARPQLYPSVYHDWLNRIKSGETGSVYYPESSNGF